MKHFILLLLVGFSTMDYCSAQPPPDDDDVRPNPPGRNPPRTPQYAIEFVPNDTCNLIINGTDYGKIGRSSRKILKLRPGSYMLLFESLETGEIIRNRSFRLNSDSLTDGKYIYTVTFKE